MNIVHCKKKVNNKRLEVKEELLKFFHDECIIIRTSFESYRGAKERVKSGIPPYKHKEDSNNFRHYDSLFWETLLYADDDEIPNGSDIFIYTNDNGFLNPDKSELNSLLQIEWSIVKGGKAHLYIEKTNPQKVLDEKINTTDGETVGTEKNNTDLLDGILSDPKMKQKLISILSENTSFDKENSNSIRNNIIFYINICDNELSMSGYISRENLDKLHKAITKADREFMLPYDEIEEYKTRFNALKNIETIFNYKYLFLSIIMLIIVRIHLSANPKCADMSA